MADDGSAQSKTAWPMPKFYFVVTFDETELRFLEVSGLDEVDTPIEYRTGDSPSFSTVKMPGLRKTGYITLRKGIGNRDNALFKWFDAIKMNTISGKAMTIRLLDEGGEATMTWHVQNAFPVKVNVTDLKTEGNEVAIEAIEIAHEGITIENA